MVKSEISLLCDCKAVLPSVVPEISPDKSYDQFGFVQERVDNSFPLCSLSLNENDKNAWLEFFEMVYSKQHYNIKWDQRLYLPPSAELTDMVFKGIPHALRGAIWLRISGALRKKANAELSYWEMLRFCDNDRITYARHIEKDLLRTLPNNVCFNSLECQGTRRLRRILRALSWYFPDIGYCQGMGIIAGHLVLFLEEEDSFWMMCAIIEDILPKLYYSESQQLLGVRTDFHVFCKLIANYLPDINAHLIDKTISLELITLQWFLTLFSGVLPTYTLLRVWDLLFLHGSIVLFRVGVAVLKMCETDICNISSSSELFSYFSGNPAPLRDFEKLLKFTLSYAPSLNVQLVELMRLKYLKMLSQNPNSENTDNDDGNSRNVQRTEIILNLRNAILRICKHFKDFDEAYGNSVAMADYSPDSHKQDYDKFSRSTLRSRCKRARAIDDFIKKDPDELGFRKNDIITVLSMHDPDCWIGEMDDAHGWFPANLVRLIDESHRTYSSAGDNSVTPKISELISECFYPSLLAVFSYGLKRRIHPWQFIELAARTCIGGDIVLSKILLWQAFQLHEDGKLLTPQELLFKLVVSLGCTSISLDSKFIAFIYAGLNEQVLHLWLESLCSCLPIIESFYEPFSFLRSPGWIQIKCELRVLSQFSFTLQLSSKSTPVDIMDIVRNLLVKHDLFSWEI